jgi:hypothetical protein
MTSIGFGGGEVIQVDMTLREVRERLEYALAWQQMCKFQVDGETILINPKQVKILQKWEHSASANKEQNELSIPSGP